MYYWQCSTCGSRGEDTDYRSADRGGARHADDTATPMAVFHLVFVMEAGADVVVGMTPREA